MPIIIANHLKMIENNRKQVRIWMNIVIVTTALLILVIGFGAGYLYGDKSCYENPFIYGIKELNKLNDDKFTCQCSSGKFPHPMFIDENEMKVQEFNTNQPFNISLIENLVVD